MENGSPLYGSYVMSANGKNVTEFLGIPFGEPPIGKLRFRKPLAKAAWREPYNATVHRYSCIQVGKNLRYTQNNLFLKIFLHLKN